VIAIVDPRRVERGLQRGEARVIEPAIEEREEAHLLGVVRRIHEFFEVTEIVDGEGEAVGVRRGGDAVVEERDAAPAAGLEPEQLARGGDAKEQIDRALAVGPRAEGRGDGARHAAELALGEEAHRGRGRRDGVRRPSIGLEPARARGAMDPLGDVGASELGVADAALGVRRSRLGVEELGGDGLGVALALGPRRARCARVHQRGPVGGRGDRHRGVVDVAEARATGND
jgi:hypothetical protein